jgi:hypothetical protein
VINVAEAIRISKSALTELQGVILQLEDAIENAGFFAPDQTISNAETQIETLEKIYDVIGPKLILRMQNANARGAENNFKALQRLLRNATSASQFIANELSVNLTLGAAISDVLRETVQDISEGAADVAKKAVPVGLIAGGVLLLYLIKK